MTAPAGRWLDPAHRFLRARFSPEGTLGLHLTIGALSLIVAGWAFGALAEDVAEADRITIVDLDIANWLHAHAGPTLTRVMLAVSNLHDVVAIGLLSTALAVFFAWRRQWYWLLALVLAVPGGMVLNTFLKLAFERPRPHFDDPIVMLETYSFPSGHVAGSTLFYGILAAFLIAHARSNMQRIAIAAAALLLVAFVAASRMLLGAHYLSDVIGAFTESIAWLALCITSVTVFRRRRAAQATATEVDSGARLRR